MNAPIFLSDIPCNAWLSEKVEDVLAAGRNQYGVLKSFGPVTGRFDRPLNLPVNALSLLPGECNEQSNVRPHSLRYIKDNAAEVFKTPVYVEVDPLGVPWVSEGNHRIMVAAELGMRSLPVQVRYFSGGERKAVGFAPDLLIEFDSIELKKLAPDTERKTNMDLGWRAKYFDVFVDSMIGNGWIDDHGIAAGQYGIVSCASGETAALAWCYPPENANDPNGLSKIIIRGVVPGGTKQDSFYFDNNDSFEKALSDSAEYAKLRLSVAAETIEKAKASREPWQEDAAMKTMYPVRMSAADTRQDQLEALGHKDEKDYADHQRVMRESRELGARQAATCFVLPAACVNAGAFSGMVVDVADGFVTQKVNREGDTVKHDVARLTAVVNIGDIVDVKYQDGHGNVSGNEKGLTGIGR